MKLTRGVSAIAVVLQACAVTSDAVTPTEQVIKMLTEMKVKGEMSMSTEKKTFDAYAEWADDRSKDLALQIKNNVRKGDELKAAIDKADNDAAGLAKEINSLNA